MATDHTPICGAGLSRGGECEAADSDQSGSGQSESFHTTVNDQVIRRSPDNHPLPRSSNHDSARRRCSGEAWRVGLGDCRVTTDPVACKAYAYRFPGHDVVLDHGLWLLEDRDAWKKTIEGAGGR
ncbi:MULTISPECIES: hypothetical protein [unclassified Streptomyces]|uniref:hypothetical protein n=1 Tax=unclassified Streptomyces TaxID=2593676 RepID=UPI00227133C1|nr:MULTISPECIES: hypothetical protein [unclassified Streptomyces]MCY0923946.1 hypothetical protein [Streptomyces sp. H27-G5]MCY0962619.1 hypothetical protein [Streptomyces sp. H27-H5]